MGKKKLKVQDIDIRVEYIDDGEYLSLTDIAKNNSDIEPHALIRSWLRNQNTLSFLEAWETTFNDNFKPVHLDRFRKTATDNSVNISPKNLIELTNAIGLSVKAGRYGGTYAHKDIALEFCSWLSPVFKVAMIKAFRVLMDKEAERKNLEWHLSKITNNIDEVRNLLDSIPGQLPELNRLSQENTDSK